MPDSARLDVCVPTLARWLLGPSIIATLATNVAHGLGHGLIGAAVGAWPAVALVGSCELLMMVVRNGQIPAVTPSAYDDASAIDPLGERAAVVFAADLAADHVPSVRAIRAALHVGEPRTADTQISCYRVPPVRAIRDQLHVGQPRVHSDYGTTLPQRPETVTRISPRSQPSAWFSPILDRSDQKSWRGLP